MSNTAITTLRIANTTTTTKVITIPSQLVNDTSFPFAMNQKLTIRIVNEELVISKIIPGQ